MTGQPHPHPHPHYEETQKARAVIVYVIMFTVLAVCGLSAGAAALAHFLGW